MWILETLRNRAFIEDNGTRIRLGTYASFTLLFNHYDTMNVVPYLRFERLYMNDSRLVMKGGMCLEALRFLLYTSYVFLYVLQIFFTSESLSYINGLIGMAALFVSFSGANRTYQVLAIIFLSVSIVGIIAVDIPISELPFYFTSMGLLLALLYVIPFINHLMIVGRFEKHLYRILQANTKHLGRFYIRTSFTHYILGLFIFLSAIPMVYRFVRQKVGPLQDAEVVHRFATQSMLRSFATVNVWSPIEVYIAVVVGITGSSYLQLLPLLLAFSFFILIVDWLFGHQRYKHERFETRQADVTLTKRDVNKLWMLFLFLSLFITSAAILHFFLRIDFFEAIILVIIPYSMIWAGIMKRFQIFMRYNQLTWPRQLQTMQNFMLLFLVLGLFNEMIGQTDILHGIRETFIGMADTPLILFIGMQLSALILSCLGVHPLVTISLQGLLIEPLLGVLNPVSISIVMITATLANDASGTFNIPITMMSQYMKRNPYQLTWWNLPFAFIFGGTGVLVAYLLL